MPLLASLPQILNDIGIAILVAAVLAFLARAAKQPLILAYVATGVLLGRSVGLSIITEAESVESISSLGLILLLYLIGLEIDVVALKRAGKSVLVSGLLQVPLNAIVCLAVPLVLIATGAVGPLGAYGVLYLSFCLSLSSTLVVVKVLYDKSELDTLPGRITLGVLVLQDLWSIIFLAVQPSLSAPEVGPLLRSLGLGGALVVGSFAAAKYALPVLFRGVARVPELLILGAIAWCFLVAGLAAKAGLSAEMGALTAGLSMSLLPYKPDIVAKVTTIRDFFLTLFFVALGLKVAAPTWGLAATAAGVSAFLLLSRFLVMFPLLRLLGAGDRAGLVVSMNLWPASEFALVVAAIGLRLEHIGGSVMDVILFTMVITAVAGTYLINATHPIYLRLQALLSRRGWAQKTAAAPEASPGAHAADHPLVLLGFHRTASALLHEIETARPDLLPQVLVVDFNPVVLEELRRRGIACAYADLANPDSLHHAGLHHCRIAVCTIPDTLFKGTTNRRLLATVRALSPEAQVLVTADTMAAEQDLLADGAAAVLVGPRAAARAVLADVLALLDGRPPLSRAGADEPRHEVLR